MAQNACPRDPDRVLLRGTSEEMDTEGLNSNEFGTNRYSLRLILRQMAEDLVQPNGGIDGVAQEQGQGQELESAQAQCTLKVSDLMTLSSHAGVLSRPGFCNCGKPFHQHPNPASLAAGPTPGRDVAHEKRTEFWTQKAEQLKDTQAKLEKKELIHNLFSQLFGPQSVTTSGFPDTWGNIQLLGLESITDLAVLAAVNEDPFDFMACISHPKNFLKLFWEKNIIVSKVAVLNEAFLESNAPINRPGELFAYFQLFKDELLKQMKAQPRSFQEQVVAANRVCTTLADKATRMWPSDAQEHIDSRGGILLLCERATEVISFILTAQHYYCLTDKMALMWTTASFATLAGNAVLESSRRLFATMRLRDHPDKLNMDHPLAVERKVEWNLHRQATLDKLLNPHSAAPKDVAVEASVPGQRVRANQNLVAPKRPAPTPGPASASASASGSAGPPRQRSKDKAPAAKLRFNPNFLLKNGEPLYESLSPADKVARCIEKRCTQFATTTSRSLRITFEEGKGDMAAFCPDWNSVGGCSEADACDLWHGHKACAQSLKDPRWCAHMPGACTAGHKDEYM